ncbi:HBR472Wp [Eremothecium sinecaudum]|uniref:THO complex subunit 2 n=1 Tax=Eremothecium sinecaudum TaxID=45286 RepID=A0A109UXP2_9SACH|nr:HBR472Wp [Eremothecium sinecaudum]AMD19373.1 HBR472Wp [Eremothecium sinecaudum]
MSLIENLNRLAKQHVPFERSVFTDEFLSDWSTGYNKLMEHYDAIEEASEKETYLYKVFTEALMFTNEDYKKLIGDNYSSLASLLSKLCSRNNKAARLLVNVVNYFPKQSEDDSNLIELVKAIEGMQLEFSTSLNEKLLAHKWTKEQLSLYKRSLISEKYHLKKYNLLFECPIGFSQLISLLNVAYNDRDRFQSLEYYSSQLVFVASKYSLDPIRVLDIILRVSSIYVYDHHEFFTELLKHSDYWPLTPSDPFDWKRLNHGGNVVASRLIANKLSSEEFDDRYMDMVCILIKEGFVSYLSILESLGPDDETVAKYVNEYYHDLEQQSMEGASNPLAMAAALPDEEEVLAGNGIDSKKSDTEGQKAAALEVKEKEEEQKQRERKNRHFQINEVGKWRLVTSCLNHGLLIPALYSIKMNEKVAITIDGLVEALIRAYDFMIDPCYKKSINTPEYNVTAKIKMKMSHSGIPSKQCRLVQERISPNVNEKFLLGEKSTFYYSKWSDRLPVIASIEDLFSQSHEILTFVGTRLTLQPQVITKLSKIAIRDIADSENSEESIAKWIDFFRKFLLPTVAALEDDFFACSSCYDLMKLFPFEKRYFMYNELLTKISEDNIFVKLNFNRAKRRIRSLLKSLSIDNIDEKANEVARVISSNPLATLEPVVNQIENYDKVSELVVISATKFPDFAYDVLQYILLLKLTSGRSSLQSDGINQCSWIQRLSSFIAGLAKVCPRMDLENIIIFTVKNMHKDYNLSIPILKELISRVGGIQSINNISWKQLHMLNSGPALRRVARSLILDTRQDTLVAARAITKLLLKMNCISELIVLLCNINASSLSSDTHYKILSTKYDDSKSLLWAFVEMLKYTLTVDEFISSVLPFDEMVAEYNIPIEWSFNIWRDCIQESNQEGKEPSKIIDTALDKTEFKHIPFANLNKELFTTFWKLSLYDVQFNNQLYDEVTEQLKLKLSKAKFQREKNVFMTEVQQVMSNCLTHQKAFKNMQVLLKEKRSNFVPELNSDTIEAFFQYCVLPRTLFTCSDAVYSALFIIELFGVKETFTIFKLIVERRILGGLLFSCTVVESENLGFFFNVLLDAFEKAREEGSFDNDSLAELFKLHSTIITDMRLLLMETNYMSIRNAIEFLNQVTTIFPVVDDHIKEVLGALTEKLGDGEREDIRLPCNALIGHLKNRLKSACKPQEFYELPAEELMAIQNKEKEDMRIKEYQDALAKDAEAEKLEQSKALKESAKSAESNKPNRYSAASTDVGSGSGTERLPPSSEGSSTVPYQVQKTLDAIDSVHNLITSAKVDQVPKLIRDFFFKDELHKALNEYNGDVVSFRKRITNILMDYFYSTVKWPRSNAPFLRKLQDLEAACLKCAAPTSKAKSKVTADDLYGEDVPTASTHPKGSANKLESRLSTANTSDTPVPKAKLERYDKKPKDNTRSTSRFKDSENKPQQPKSEEKPLPSRFNSGKVPIATPTQPSELAGQKVQSNALRDRVSSRFEGRQEPSRISGPRAETSRFPQAPSRQADAVTESRFRNAPKEPSRKRPASDYRYNSDVKRQRQADDNKRKPNKERRLEIHANLPPGPKKGGVSRFR